VKLASEGEKLQDKEFYYALPELYQPLIGVVQEDLPQVFHTTTLCSILHYALVVSRVNGRMSEKPGKGSGRDRYARGMLVFAYRKRPAYLAEDRGDDSE
jgi:hypothetical protein